MRPGVVDDHAQTRRRSGGTRGRAGRHGPRLPMAFSTRLSPQAAYNTGFIIYWLAGCIGFPIVVLGPRRAARLLTQERRPSGTGDVMLFCPRLATEQRAATESQEYRWDACRGDGETGVINATGEELLWRGRVSP